MHVPISKVSVAYKTIRHRSVTLWHYIVKTMDCNHAFVIFKCQLKVFVFKQHALLVHVVSCLCVLHRP